MDKLKLTPPRTRIKELISKERSQYWAFISLSLVVAVLTGVMYFSDTNSFQSYIGKINPLVLICSTIILGAILLSFLLSKGLFVIYNKGNFKGLFLSASIATLFAFVIIVVDLIVVFPDDLNVLFPKSLLFYPAIGYVAEIFFHVLPLSLLFFFLTALFKKISHEKIIWVMILIVSLLEPIYQTVSGFSEPYPLWTITYVGVHVFLFNLFQLIIFKRYDFISMYAFRLVYYLLWHIAWGYIRLGLLF